MRLCSIHGASAQLWVPTGFLSAADHHGDEEAKGLGAGDRFSSTAKTLDA